LDLKELINKCKKNDRSAQSELFSRYKDTLYFVSLKYSRNDEEAKDNLHDAFITIFQTISKYRGRGSFEGWMKRITIFKAIDKFKAKKATPIAINDDLLKDSSVEVEEDLINLPLDTILTLIQELPDQYRMVFNLYQLDGFKHREISEILNISANTSKSNYHRAKVILKDKITALTTPKTKIKN
jgi:RNA polymerase sigma factor (sigma-70 family)